MKRSMRVAQLSRATPLEWHDQRALIIRSASSLNGQVPRLRSNLEIFMRLLFASLLLLSVSACVVAPIGGDGKAGGDTVVVCHKGKKTLELPRSAADAHLGHGDSRGPC